MSGGKLERQSTSNVTIINLNNIFIQLYGDMADGREVRGRVTVVEVRLYIVFQNRGETLLEMP
jgi:hypothetical protein